MYTHKGQWVQETSVASEKVLSNIELEEVERLYDVLHTLESTSGEIETTILSTVLALVEFQSDACDILCASLFADVPNHANVDMELGSSTMLANLNSHYENRDVVEHAASTAMKYYITLQTIAASSKTYGPRIQKAIRKWEKKIKTAPFFYSIGQIEIVRDDKLSAVFFPIPAVAVATRDNPVVRDLQHEIVSSTVLMHDQERVREFIRAGPLIMKIMQEQNDLQGTVLKRIYIREAEISSFLLLLVLGLCILYTLDPDDAVMFPSKDDGSYEIAWSTLGFAHVLTTTLHFCAYAANRWTIDYSHMQFAMITTSLWTNPVEHALKVTSFWLFSTRGPFTLFLVGCKMLFGHVFSLCACLRSLFLSLFPVCLSHLFFFLSLYTCVAGSSSHQSWATATITYFSSLASSVSSRRAKACLSSSEPLCHPP